MRNVFEGLRKRAGAPSHASIKPLLLLLLLLISKKVFWDLAGSEEQSASMWKHALDPFLGWSQRVHLMFDLDRRAQVTRRGVQLPAKADSIVTISGPFNKSLVPHILRTEEAILLLPAT